MQIFKPSYILKLLPVLLISFNSIAQNQQYELRITYTAKEGINEGIKLIEKIYLKTESESYDKIREIMMQIRTDLGISASKLFQAFYLILLGKKKGPRIGPLMEMLNKKWVENRLKEI